MMNWISDNNILVVGLGLMGGSLAKGLKRLGFKVEAIDSRQESIDYAVKNGIIDEDIDPFLCPIRSQNGAEISDGTRAFTPEELMRMDWLCDNVEGIIPEYDDLLPQSRELVRLLGIHREAIPPKKEESI